MNICLFWLILRRGIEKWRPHPRLPRGFQNIERFQSVDFEIFAGRRNRCRNGNLRGQMENLIGIPMLTEQFGELGPAADVEPDKLQRALRLEPLEILLNTPRHRLSTTTT